MKKINIIFIAVLMLVLVGCNKTDEVDVTDEVSNIIPVEVEVPVSGSVSNDTVIAGKLTANDTAIVSAMIAGAEDVLEVNFEVGDFVIEGDILVVLDSEATEDQIESARLAYITTKRNYEALLESTNSSKSNLIRTKELYESGVASEQQLEGAELQASDAQLKTVQSQLSQSYFAYENAKKALDNTVIIAPTDGIISSMNFKENNLATSQSNIVITDITSLDINLSVTENIINKVKKGSGVLIEIDSANDEVIKSSIKYVNPVADLRTGLYSVVINIENTDGLYKPGMFAKVLITLDSSEFAVLIPIDSLLSDDQGSYVYTVKDNVVIRKDVEIGIDNGEVIEILSGLSLEDLVVVKGQNYINEDSEIRVIVGGN